MSGAIGERFAPVTASVFSRPAFAWVMATLLVKETCTSPAISAASAGAPPLYGTWVISMPAMCVNSAPDR